MISLQNSLLISGGEAHDDAIYLPKPKPSD